MPPRSSRFLRLLTFWASVALGCSDTETSAPAVVTTHAGLATIGAAYDIQIVTAQPVFPVRTYHGKIEGHAATANEIDRYAVLFSREFTLYPPDLIKRAKLKCVVLCKDLSYAGQLRGAIPDFEHDTLYLDVVRGGYDRSYVCKAIHHEFFHVIDYRDDRLLYADEHWAALNPAGFKYGTGGKNAQGVPTASVLTDTIPGFLNYYSTTGVEEDKAEMFANLIVDSAYVEERARTDRVLKTKIQAIKELAVAFCPAVNEQFWAKATQTSRSDD
jgi:hypothetical protein